MTHIETQTPVQSPLKKIFEKASMSIFLFSFALALLLILSWYFVLPRFTTIEVAGEPRSLSYLLSHQAQLKASIVETEEKRDHLVSATSDPQYDALKALKAETLSMAEINSLVHRAATESSDQPDSIHIDSLTLSSETKTLEIRGDVRFVGPGSQTVLAQFVDTVSELSFVKSVQAPRFERSEDPKVGFHSPFTFTVTLP